MTHAERIDFATREHRCFACADYDAPFKHLSGLCRSGGLDPEATAAAPSVASRNIRATVRCFNTCPRFTLAQQVAA